MDNYYSNEMKNMYSIKPRNPVIFFRPEKARKSFIVSHHTYDKTKTEAIINISTDSDSFETDSDNSRNFKGFLPPRKIKNRAQIKEFSLSDSEYGSLKNEKCTGLNRRSNTLNVVRKICDSTTDLQVGPAKVLKLKEMSPEPKISTTYLNLTQNNCESSSGYTYSISYIPENRSIPFKKRYIHNYHAKMNSKDVEKNQRAIIKLQEHHDATSDTEMSSCTSRSSSTTTPINEPDVSEQIESNNKVNAWNADFQAAYNNDYDEFNEECRLKLEEKISKAKSQYVNQLLKATMQEYKLSKRKASLTKSHFMEYCSGCNTQQLNKFKSTVNPLDNNEYHLVRIHSLPKTKIHRQLNPMSITTNSAEPMEQTVANVSSFSKSNNNSTNYFNSNITEKTNTLTKLGTKRKRRKKFAETPLSPETTKRNEFYSYLQISTKPRVNSDGVPIEPNRRSVRVKNIEIIKERDRSLSEEFKFDKVETKNKSETSKSPRDSNQTKVDIKKIFLKPKLNTKKGKKMRKFLLKRSTEQMDTVQDNSNQNHIKDEFGFSIEDKKLSLDTQNKLALAIADIDSSLQYFNNLKCFRQNSQRKQQSPNQQIIETERKMQISVEEKSKKQKRQRRNIALPLNHINGPVTRHSNAVINKTLTRSSHTKIPKLNLDAVMKRMYNKRQIRKYNKSKRLKSLKEKTSITVADVDETHNRVSFNESLLDRRKDVSNILNAVNNEVLKVQSNILELSTQKSFYDDHFSECSKVSEHSFHGFGIQSHASISSSVSTSVPLKSDISFIVNEPVCFPQRRMSLPTYINNQREQNLEDLLGPDDYLTPSSENTHHSQSVCDVCQKDSTICLCHIDLELPKRIQMPTENDALTLGTHESSPKFIPLSPNTSVKPFHPIFTKRSHKLTTNISCQFGQECVSQFENYESFDDDICNKISSGLRQSIIEKLHLKQEKVLNSSEVVTRTSKSKQHCIDISSTDGSVLNVNFVNSILIVVQDNSISFWQQTPLGTMLGAQNMWLSLGKLQRLKMGAEYFHIPTLSASYLCTENATAYIELWAKEHKSEKRERPITDIFATVYFYSRKGNNLEKKVIQLENIKGFAQDVRYVSLKFGRSVVVSWRDQFSSPPVSQIRKYQIAIDFQTVLSVMEIESVEHYISALRDAKECSEMVLGIGDLQISVWHLLQGKLITTVAISNTRSPSTQGSGPLMYYNINCVWALCDRGFLFLLNKTENNSLQLIAINGLLKDWKNLQVYKIPPEYNDIQDVIVDGGILSACSKKGLVCWSVQSGTVLLQCPLGPNVSLYSCDSHVLLIDQHLNVQVKSIFVFLLED